MSKDKPQHIRTPLQCKIKISHKSFGEIIVKTLDISYGGIFVALEAGKSPPIGAIVTGQMQGVMNEAPMLEVEVARVGSSGIGLRFINVE